MNVRDLLAEPRRDGCLLEHDEAGRLIVRPQDHVTDKWRATLKAHKADLVAALKAEPPPAAQRTLDYEQLVTAGNSRFDRALETRGAGFDRRVFGIVWPRRHGEGHDATTL